ncbi:MAG: OsmC family protein, partial [Gammaproteobacteria bacterium]|nr:OsmC family protein [Gammaproteobacteria bacterium]
MSRIKIEFENADGDTLAGLLETPPEQITIARYALFAHCFTCGKDIAAASRISRALADRGIAVLRFDFTGLGNSDGDFANSNFSSNVDDLIAAAKKLETDYQAPQLIIGHSLGGAAVLTAAQSLSSIKAVVTIGAPATAQHVEHLFKSKSDVIKKEGEAVVDIGGREFRIRKQLLDDISVHNSTDQIANINKALLVYHSPIDSIVSINQAALIYQAARHPKSFISLDQADHLLSKAADAAYVAATLAAWAGRYLELDSVDIPARLVERPKLDVGEVLVSELDKQFLRGLYSDNHRLMADEPLKYGGSNLGPTPYDLLLMSLGACTSMTLRMYANRKKLALDDVEVTLLHQRVHAEDCEDCDHKIEKLVRRIKLTGDLSNDQKLRLIEIADKCPVHRTLESDPQIV